MTDTDKQEMRAALMQFEKALEIQRACVIRVRKVLERDLKTEHLESGGSIISSTSTVAGAVSPTVTT